MAPPTNTSAKRGSLKKPLCGDRVNKIHKALYMGVALVLTNQRSEHLNAKASMEVGLVDTRQPEY